MLIKTSFLRLFYAILVQILLTSAISLASEELENRSIPDGVPFFNDKEEKVFLDEFEDKTILLTFWAVWSPPCLQEILNLEILKKDFKKLPFEVIAVSEDFQGVKKIKDYFKTAEIRHLKIYHDYKNQLFKAFSVIGLPTSFLIDSNGKIVISFLGSTDWNSDDIRKRILSYIPGNPIEPKNSYEIQDLNKKIKSKKHKGKNNE